MKSKALLAVVFSVILLSTNSVYAATFMDNQVVAPNKAWTIKFNDEISFDDLTKEAITIKDIKGNKINTGLQLGQDNKTLIVTAPEDGYAAGYWGDTFVL